MNPAALLLPLCPCALVQDPASATPAAATSGAGGGVLGWLAEFASRPGVVETLLAALCVGIGVAIWLRLLRVVETVRSRSQLGDYLFGVEQALAGDLRGAHDRLSRVLQVDPENHFARLLLGKVLAQLGEPAQAHKHHLYLQRAFGVESGENDLELARALLLCGRPAEAAEAAQRVVAGEPRHAAALAFLLKAQLQAGDPESAAAAGRRLLQLPGQRTDELAREVADAAASAGQLALRRGDFAAAQRLLAEAKSGGIDTQPMQLLAARIDAARDGGAVTAARLLAASLASPANPANAALPVAVGSPAARALEPLRAGASWLPVAAGLLPPGRWRCGACGAAVPSASAPCSRCGAESRAEVDEPALFVAVAAPGHLADAIEANQAHVRRTVRAALDAPVDERGNAVRAAVAALGERAVAELLGVAVAGSEAIADTAVRLLQQLGPAITPALFVAADELEDRRLLPGGGAGIAHVVGRVVQGFDREALPHVEVLFAKARASSRKILIDYFLGLADLQEFQLVLERFPPLEILHRLNKIDAAVLRRFLQAVPPQHFVAEVLLLEATFYREDELLAAIPAARHPEVLERVLVQRGPSRTLFGELLRALGDAALQPVALRVLQSFSGRVQEHLVAAFVDRDRDAAVRQQLGRLLAGLGPAAVDRLCSSFGPEPTSLDDELRAVLVAMGDGAVPALQGAYVRPGWVERLTVGMFGRGGNRRAQIARALATLATPAARAALQQLREQENDPNLKLRLQQALHRLDELALGAGDGDAGTGGEAASGGDAGDREQDDGGRHGQVG